MNWHWPFVFIGFTNNIHEYDNVDHELIILIISIILPNLTSFADVEESGKLSLNECLLSHFLMSINRHGKALSVIL